MKRYAFTLIELIFAIVIMSIVVLSMPMILRTNSNALSANIVQEAIFAASAKTMQILSFPWDYDSNGTDGSYNKIVTIPPSTWTSADYARSQNNLGVADSNGSFRVGAILEPGHRRFHAYDALDANVTAMNLTSPNPLNRMYISTDFINPTPTAAGYKNDYNTTTTVTYIADNTSAPFVFTATGQTMIPTNMKLVTVYINNVKTGQTMVKLRSYVANIGETDFASRIY